MTTQGVELITLVHTAGGADPRSQHVRMVGDLGQPATNVIDVGTTTIGTALDTAVARVRVVGGY